MKTYDVAVVGAGVMGCCVARELARYSLSVIVLEAGNDIACGATRANSGIVHAGFDPEPGSNKARYNVEGSRLFPQWCAELGFAYYRNGSLVAAFNEEEAEILRQLQARGKANGVSGALELVDGAEARRLEPSLSPAVAAALVVEGGAICDPYDVALAAAENAAMNGVEFSFLSEVTHIRQLSHDEAPFLVALSSGEEVRAHAIVNAAGVYADEINNMISGNKLSIIPVKGEYCLYNPDFGTLFQRTIFQTPTPNGKGVLVSPTIHGNLFVGPTSIPQESKRDVSTSKDGLALLMDKGRKTWPEASGKGIITNFAGLRAHGTLGDFVVGEASDVPGFFNAACIESPGLSAAPAIATHLAEDIAAHLSALPNPHFDPLRKSTRRFVIMNDEDRKAAIEENPLWGNIVCQCCKVSEAELVDALHGPLPVLSFDALKWRCGATMGPCHGGFCTPEIMSIVSRELEINPTALDKRTPGSWLVSQARQNHAELARSKESFGNEVFKPKHLQYDVVVVGAGAAGMAAAKKANEKGASVLLLDRGERAGGILLQCIHSGFGLHRFKEELTGPEYASREAQAFGGNGPELVPRSTVLSITPRSEEKPTFSIKVASESGMHCIEAKAVVLATGSRERGLGTLNLPGSRPSGVYSAGSAQALINLHGCLPGTKAVVLGSGDIGLIMARRMTLEGMSVEGVYEIADRPSGLRRNIVQCLDDFGIPLHLSKTVTKLEGESRLEAVWISKVDPDTWQPIQGTEERIACDTLVLSIGLEPETELAKQLGVKLSRLTNGADVNQTMSTNIPGIFTCGNALHIHDLADYASSEGDVAGENAARFALEHTEETDNLPVIAGEGVRYAVPQSIQKGILRTSTVSFRVNKTMKRPLMEIVGVRKDGTRDMLAKTKCAVAVPAEMIRMTLATFDSSPYAHIEVNASERESR